MRKISTLWSTSAKYSVLTTGATVMTRLSPRDLFFKDNFAGGGLFEEGLFERYFSRGTYSKGGLITFRIRGP